MPKKLGETASGEVSYLTNWKKLIDVSTISVLQYQLFLKGLQFFCFRIFAPIDQLDEARNTQKNNQTIYKKAGSSLKASVKKEKNVKKQKLHILQKQNMT